MIVDRRPARLLVVGPKTAGKTGYARRLAARAGAAGLTVGGFFSDAEWEGGEKARYWLTAASGEGDRSLLASARPGPGLDLRVGMYHLSRATLLRGNRLLRGALDADLVCIDEFGPLELRGEGFWPGTRFLLERYRGVLLVTARPTVAPALEEILRTMGVWTARCADREPNIAFRRVFVRALPTTTTGRIPTAVSASCP